MTKPLSPRETQIARMILAGMAHKNIATDLHLSPSTVRVVWCNVMRKSETHNAIQFSKSPLGIALQTPPSTPTTMPMLCTAPAAQTGFNIHQQVRIDSRLSGHNGRSGIVCDRSETGASYEVMLLDAPGKPRRRVWFNADELQEVGA